MADFFAGIWDDRGNNHCAAIRSPSGRSMKALLAPGTFTPGGYYPLGITRQQYGRLHFALRTLRLSVTGDWMPFAGSYDRIEDYDLGVAGPADDTDLLHWPGCYVRQFRSATLYMSLGIGAPIAGADFAPPAHGLGLYPYARTWPVTMSDEIPHSPFVDGDGIEIPQTGVDAAKFVNGLVYPFLWLEIGWNAGFVAVERLSTFHAHTSGINVGLTSRSLRVFDWGSIPLYLARSPSAAAAGYTLPSDIALDFASTY